MSDFSYAEVEGVLAHVYEAQSSVALPKLRARYKKLKALGLPSGPKPRRGAKTGYSLTQLLELVICMELIQFGMEPQLLVSLGLVKLFDERLSKKMESLTLTAHLYTALSRLDHPDESVRNVHIVMAFIPSHMSHRWDEETVPFIYTVQPTKDCARFLDESKYHQTRLCIMSFQNVAFKVRRAIDFIKPSYAGYYKHGEHQKA